MGVWWDTKGCFLGCETGRSKTPTKVFGLEFAPLHIPLERRLQTLGAMNWVGSFVVLGFGSLFLCAYILVATKYWWIVGLYIIWYWYDRHTPSRGGRQVSWVRKMRVWRWMRDYFPIRLVKTSPLAPDQNYILGYHPHGIFSTGAFCNFATDATNFSDVFPGLRPILLALAGQFSFPLFREYFMTSGSCSCSKESMEWLLTREGRGNAIVLIVGGAAEVLDARPGSFTLTARSRKGFIKLAMKHGVSLVPMYSFGENDIYNQAPNLPGSLVRAVQERLRRVCGFAMPIVRGRGIFNYTVGLLPQRRPITTVVGAPLAVEKVASPNEEQIEAVWCQYFQALEDLFEQHKANYDISSETHLVFV